MSPKVRPHILHPVLRAAYDADWYTPWQPPQSFRRSKLYKQAIAEGWAEWIQTPLDVEAVKAGYRFDLSRDTKGRPCYWFDGGWHRRVGKRMQAIALEDEEHEIVHIGAGDHAARFFELFIVQTKEPLVGQPFRHLTWHAIVTHSVYGWTHRESGLRRYRKAYIAIPKKNVKSAYCSCAALKSIRADGEAKAYTYGAAVDRQQARVVFDEAADYVRKSEVLADDIYIVDSKARLIHMESGSFYSVLSADAHRAEGLDAHTVIMDEIHVQPNRKLFVKLKRAGRARRQPLFWIITTYGTSLDTIWGEEHLKAKKILDGTGHDWQTFVLIASAEPIPVVVTDPAKVRARKIKVQRLQQPIAEGSELEFSLSKISQRETEEGEENDDGHKIAVTLSKPARRFDTEIVVKPLRDDLPAFSEAIANTTWDDDHAIRRANPAVDIVFPIDEIRRDIADSRVSPAATAECQQLSLNILSGGGMKWLSQAAWQACGVTSKSWNQLRGRRCFGGLDLSFTNDLSAFWLAFPLWDDDTTFSEVVKEANRNGIGKLIALRGMAWVAGEGIEDREESEEIPYRAYAEQMQFDNMPLLRVCDTATIDYEQMGQDIVDFCEPFALQAIAYDPRYSMFVIEPYLDPAGLECVPHRQGAMSMGPPTKRLEQLLLNRWLDHGNHPLLDRAASAAVLHSPDRAGNRYPSKDKSKERIDPLISAIMAAGWACDPPEYDGPQGAYSGAAGSGMWG